MPTTFTGLVLFIVLLLPGFAYLVGKERHGVERRTSGFRDTVSVVAASVAVELPLLIITSPLWSRSVDVNKAINNPGDHLAVLTVWGAALLLCASAITYLWSWPRTRRKLDQILGHFKGRLSWIPDMIGTGYPHASTVSAWWITLRQRRDEIRAELGTDPTITVGCYLDDGSYIVGGLAYFSQLADETPDRDLILAEPYHRPAGGRALEKLDTHVAVVSARRIVAMTVKYYVSPSEPELPPSELELSSASPEAGGVDG